LSLGRGLVSKRPGFFIMKVLNLYSGIGGNRKLWQDVEVTAVENNESIAKVYQDYFPEDKMIIGDAHQYLLDHFKEFDFIWSSPPCPSHSRTSHFLNALGTIRYPDMGLWQEIIFLQHFFKRKYIIENVVSYYDPLIIPQQIDRHYYWANFKIPFIKFETSSIGRMGPVKKNYGKPTAGANHYKLGFDLQGYKGIDKNKVLNNCVHPETGLYILNCARNIITKSTHQTALEL